MAPVFLYIVRKCHTYNARIFRGGVHKYTPNL